MKALVILVLCLTLSGTFSRKVSSKNLDAEKRQIYRDDVKKKVPPPPAKPFEGDPNLGDDDESAWFVDENKSQEGQHDDGHGNGSNEYGDFPDFVSQIFGENYDGSYERPKPPSYEKPYFEQKPYKPEYEEKPAKPSYEDEGYRPTYNVEPEYPAYEKPYEQGYDEQPYKPVQESDSYDEKPYRPSYESKPYEPEYATKPYKPEYVQTYGPSYDEKPYKSEYEPEYDSPFKAAYPEKPYQPAYIEKPYKPYKKPASRPAQEYKEPVLLKPGDALSSSVYQKDEYNAIHEQHGYTADYKAGSIPGKPGQDYPNYTAIPPTKFQCYDQKKSDDDNVRYADPETRCQVFHACVHDRMESFLCPLGTIFEQETQQCGWWYEVECKY